MSMRVGAGWGESLRAERASGDRPIVGRMRAGHSSVALSTPRRRARTSVIAALGVLAVWLVAAASASAFNAQGSVKQVYVTGLAPNAEVSLLRGGGVVDTQNADSEGGLLFRNVKPGLGYQVQVASNGEKSGNEFSGKAGGLVEKNPATLRGFGTGALSDARFLSSSHAQS